MDRQLTLGSLFSGSGGFELAGMLNDIKPVWLSEIDPFASLVTTKRFPNVAHYGDISTLNGADLEPVDIITFGSPCTNLSVAGQRAGLDGAQSALFFQAIRIIKEMRCKTNGKYPRWICWENVFGVFSSSQGRDFQRVLEEIIGIVVPNAKVPAPDGYRWPYADTYVGDGWSVAYRTLDSQWYGVAQRRRRCYLVADFGSERAADVLFERQGMSRYFAQGFDTWERAADDPENRSGATGFDRYNGELTGDTAQTLTAAAGQSGNNMPLVFQPTDGEEHDTLCLNDQGGDRMDVSEGVAATLRAQSHGHEPCVLHAAGFCTEHSANSRSIGYEEEVSPTLRAGVVPAALSVENHPADGRVGINEDGKAQTLTKRCGTGGMNVPLVAEAQKPDVQHIAYGLCSKKSHSMLSDNPHSGFYEAQTARTLDKSGGSPLCNQGGIAVVAIQGSMIGRAEKNGPQGSGVGEDVSFTLDVADRHGVAYAMTTGSYTQIVKDRAPTLQHRDWKDPPIVTEEETPPTDVQYVVRRLTPTECAVLQGFPRWYCSELAITDPTEEQIAFWTDVWRTYADVTGEKKPKDRRQVISWLAKPYSTSAEYRVWGNGISLPCAVFVLGGITELMENERGTD